MARTNPFIDKVDEVIGRKILDLRVAAGLSRQQLAIQLDITHQQLAKIEYGQNRIAAGRLIMVSRALNQPLEEFFEGVREENEILPTQGQRMAIEVGRNFKKIKNPKHRMAGNIVMRLLSEI